MITYATNVSNLSSEMLSGFFVGWDNPPTPETHLRLLQKSDRVIIATDPDGRIVGFITAITDSVLSAYIPFLEVLPEYQNKGIGSELVSRMMSELEGYYMIDLMCDPEMQNWYKQFGFDKSVGMMRRNYKHRAGV